MKTALKTMILILSLLLLAGCGAESPAPKSLPQDDRGQQQAWIDTEMAWRVKEAAKSVKGVKDSTAIVVDKDVSVAVKVTGLDRFRLKSLREEVHKKVSGLAAGYQVHVTTDKKLFSELQKVQGQIGGGQPFQPGEIKKTVDKINKDMEG